MTTDIQERLLRVDTEIHAILHELRSQTMPRASIDELASRMEGDVVSDEDSTEVVRTMRDRAYDL